MHGCGLCLSPLPKSDMYSLFTLRKPRSPLMINGKRGFVRVNILLHSERMPLPTFFFVPFLYLIAIKPLHSLHCGREPPVWWWLYSVIMYQTSVGIYQIWQTTKENLILYTTEICGSICPHLSFDLVFHMHSEYMQNNNLSQLNQNSSDYIFFHKSPRCAQSNSLLLSTKFYTLQQKFNPLPHKMHTSKHFTLDAILK